MRRLYLVPIIHSRPDMGSISALLEKRASAAVGKEIWRRHQEVVSSFWDAIARFCASIEASGLQVYQDGLIADGAAGLEVVRRGIQDGSANYRIIGELLDRGAVLVRTEDARLVGQEHAFIQEISRSRSRREMEAAIIRYRQAQGGLLVQRDTFIARTINESLRESGILFIGAYHSIAPALAPDIRVIPVKEIARVRAYHQALARGQAESLRRLAEYLVYPVELHL